MATRRVQIAGIHEDPAEPQMLQMARNLTDWEDGHYVVAIGYDNKNIYLMDPSTLGNYTFIPIPEFLDRWHDQDPYTSEFLIHFGMVIDKGQPQYDFREIKYLANQYPAQSFAQ